MPRACYRLPPEKHPASHRESIAKLAVIQLRIEPILCHQGFMAALLNDMSVLHDKDHIRFRMVESRCATIKLVRPSIMRAKAA